MINKSDEKQAFVFAIVVGLICLFGVIIYLANTASSEPAYKPNSYQSKSIPTPTPSQSLSYYSKISVMSKQYVIISNLGTSLFDNPNPYSSVWRSSVISHSNDMIDISEQILSIQAPAQHSKSKSLLDQSMYESISAYKLYISSMHSASSGDFNTGTFQVESGTDHLERGSALLSRANMQFNSE